jgi:hypothetical protein
MPSGVRTPVVSMSIRALIGMVQAFELPGTFPIWEQCRLFFLLLFSFVQNSPSSRTTIFWNLESLIYCNPEPAPTGRGSVL